MNSSLCSVPIALRLLAFLAATLAATPGSGQQQPVEAPDESPAKRRLEAMRRALDELQVTSTAIKSPAALKFGKAPLLRYSDQTRRLLDAAVWRLGETGRPTAFVILELRPGEGAEVLSYEFCSLASEPFAMESALGIKWSPAGAELKMLSLDGAPQPAASPRARLAQLRQLAQRFAAREVRHEEPIACRLMPQPIDRYSDIEAGIVDGAVFTFANGTNPELGLLLECSDKAWSYGAFRLSAAALVAELDGKTFLTVEAVTSLQLPPSAPYCSRRHPIDLPEVKHGSGTEN